MILLCKAILSQRWWITFNINLLHLKKQNQISHQPQAGEHPETKQNANTEDATSYDDELQAKDDEVDEIKPQFDELTDLPKDAQDALSGILDVADQALRITDQFSHTVVRGDSLKDVLELSGLEDDTAKNLIAEYPELKNFARRSTVLLDFR